MSTAIAMAPSPAPHDRPAYASEIQHDAPEPSGTSRPLPSLAAASDDRADVTMAEEESPVKVPSATPAKSSPASGSRRSAGPKIVVKKEPGSPDPVHSRPRPKKLDLSKSDTAGAALGTGRLGIQEVGIACLSPGFITNDPLRNDKLRQSECVKEQQRRMIEARLHQSAKGELEAKDKDHAPFTAKTPGMMSRRNKAPPGLSIVAPSHEKFAHERVIQSAPLGQTFTGRNNPQPLSRHIVNHASNLSSTSHIHHVPATQTNNRLPPISDVFGQGLSTHHENPPHTHSHPMYAANPATARPLASPNPHAQQHPAQTPSRSREYKSAEEAQIEMTGGRPELLPKLVSYSGPHNPPTPPGQGRAPEAARSVSAGRRRTRAEYEEGDTPPLGYGPSAQRRGPFGQGRDSPETQRAKKEEFLQLCSRAWDLFHS
jgi:hypothetical protein